MCKNNQQSDTNRNDYTLNMVSLVHERTSYLQGLNVETLPLWFLSCFLVFAMKLNWKWHIEGPLLSLSCLKCILYDLIFHHTRPIFILRYSPDKSVWQMCQTHASDSGMYTTLCGYGRLMGIRREKENKMKEQVCLVKIYLSSGWHTHLNESLICTSMSLLKKHWQTVC